MSIKSDAEAGGSVPTPSGTQQSLYLDSTLSVWSSKTSSGATYPLGGLLAIVNRTSSATVSAYELTVFTGSTAAQTLTLPVTPINNTLYALVNDSSVSVTLAAGAGNTINNLGTVGSITATAGTAYAMSFSGTVWYVFGASGVGSAGASAAVRTSSATVSANEATIFSGSTAAQTLTLPTTPTAATLNSVTNNASVAVTLAAGGGGDTINNFGTVGSITVQPGDTFRLTYTGGVWYAISSNTKATSSYTPNHATVTTPTFVSGTSQQLNTAQDVMLYISITGAFSTNSVAIGPTSTPAYTVKASTGTPGVGALFTIRVPASWYVTVTGTVANATYTAITC